MDVESMFSRCGLPLPLGLGYLVSFAKKNGFQDIAIIDLLVSGWDFKTDIDSDRVYIGLPAERLHQRLEEINPDYVGISCTFTSQAESLHLVADSVKKFNPGIKVFVGGAHPSSAPVSCLKDNNIDWVICGEGEVPFCELLQSEFKGDLSSIKGLYYKKDGECRFSGKGKFLKNLDDIPYPAYHKFDVARYLEANEKGLGQRGGYRPTFSVITSRGCPYQCVFCSIHNISGSKWRGRSPMNVLGEIEMLIKEYGARHFLFEDDNMTVDMKRAETIFKEMAGKHKNITWSAPNGIRADRMSVELAQAMKESGCISVSLGIESGDQKFLNSFIKKKLDLREVQKTTKILTRVGINVIGFFILGIPGETEESIKTSVDFAKKLARMGLVPHFFIVTPLPGTDLFDMTARDNLFVTENPGPADYFRATYQTPMLRPTGMSLERLLKWRKKAVLSSMLMVALFKPFVFIRYLSGGDVTNLRSICWGLKRKIHLAMHYLWN